MHLLAAQAAQVERLQPSSGLLAELSRANRLSRRASKKLMKSL